MADSVESGEISSKRHERLLLRRNVIRLTHMSVDKLLQDAATFVLDAESRDNASSEIGRTHPLTQNSTESILVSLYQLLKPTTSLSP